MSIDIKSIEKLKSDIEILRKQLIELGLCKGLEDHETIQLSQKLDQLLNQYERLKTSREN